MPSFACEGWLFITVTDSSPVVQIKLTHAESHPPYVETEVPPEIVDYVQKNHELPLVKVIYLVYQHHIWLDLTSYLLLDLVGHTCSIQNQK